MSNNKQNIADHKDVWVFTEIQDHERVLEGALELLTKGRELANRLGQKLCALVLGLEAEQYLPEIEKFGPNEIIYLSDKNLKHYNSEIFPDIITALVEEHKPSIVLLPSTEAGKDLGARLARRCNTGLTTHCIDLDIVDSEEYGKGLLQMKRLAYSGNMCASIICPHSRPQMATVQPGILDKKEAENSSSVEIKKIDFSYDVSGLKISNQAAPVRWNRHHVPLEQASVICAGGRGLESKRNFDKLFDLSDILNGEVGATRVPVFNEWCEEERMIGQTGKNIRPQLYLGFGISGQVQHTGSILDSEIIVSVNVDDKAPISEISDYVIREDANRFLSHFIERLRQEKSLFNK
ncbi:MAG: electron transfer flavoprotein subunit alpha/FixB family protein [bacterium]|nr:electron transfer flavoprotein subunit alpha/FixB family protein [bacterium]